MANGRLLDGDRKFLKGLINWDNLHKANPWPLTHEQSEEMLMTTYTEAQQAAFVTLLSDEATAECVSRVRGRITMVIDDACGLEIRETTNVSHLYVRTDNTFMYPEPEGYEDDRYQRIDPRNMHYIEVSKWMREAQRLDRIGYTCARAVSRLVDISFGVNTYGQVKRVWPDIVQLLPAEWQERINNASRASRMPPKEDAYYWDRYAKGMEKLTDYAVQCMLLKDGLTPKGRFEEGAFDTMPMWEEWASMNMPKIVKPQDIVMPWD